MVAKIVVGARLLVGLVLVVFGSNGLLHFVPFPPMSGPPGDFSAAMMNAGYFFPFVHGTEVTAGVLLLSGRFVPLALTVLAPLVLNILAFHLFLAPSGLAAPLLIAALVVFLAWSYRSAFRPLLRSDAPPDAVADAREPHGAKATRAAE
jgi:uncharacterized membrane protein YphA (DoxX/SURF4 family)